MEIPLSKVIRLTKGPGAVGNGNCSQMLKRLSWKEGGVISLQLREGLYTLAQMRVSPCMQFYAVSTSDGFWAGVDLGAVPSLFCVAVSGKRLMPLMVEMVERSTRPALPRIAVTCLGK